jgi:hypothetical protein
MAFPYGLPRLRRAYTQHDFAQHKGVTHAENQSALCFS